MMDGVAQVCRTILAISGSFMATKCSVHKRTGPQRYTVGTEPTECNKAPLTRMFAFVELEWPDRSARRILPRQESHNRKLIKIYICRFTRPWSRRRHQ